MKEVIVLQQVACEGLGTIEVALAARRVKRRFVRLFEGQRVPKETGSAAGLIVMGGPMGVYEDERYPFLRDELGLIEEALRIGKPVLGVCLGSQLLAAVLGAAVTSGHRKEIGWHTVRLASAAAADDLWKGIESSFTAYHWHGDVFALPNGAVPLASSEITAYQAFRYSDTAYGLLFHLEVTRDAVHEMVSTFAGELAEAGIDGGAIVAEGERFLRPLQGIGETVFGRWAGLVARLAG